MKNTNSYQKVVPFIIFVLALFLLFNLVRPMIVILLSSVILAYIAFPLYKKINEKIPNKFISIILSLLVIAVIVLIPLSFLVFGITQQMYYFQHSLSENIEKGALFGLSCTGTDSAVCLFVNQVEQFSLERLSMFGLDGQLKKFLPIFGDVIKNFLLRIPIAIAQILFTLVITFFILWGQENILQKIVNLLPMRAKTVKRLVTEFGNITHTVIYAQLFVALVQGIIGIIGFYIFGVPFPVLLGVMLAFCALIPAIGTSLVWVPASLFLMLGGYFSHDYWMLGKGIGLFAYGLAIISTIDNILLATIVRAKTRVNPIVVIVGVIGGVSLFGIAGLFIGPILLPLLLTYFETFKERFN